MNHERFEQEVREKLAEDRRDVSVCFSGETTPDELDTDGWRRNLAASSSPTRWIGIARREETEGRYVMANGALAAARWLDRASTEAAIEEVISQRSEETRTRFPIAPSPGYRSLGFAKRHWTAWSWKSSLRGVPNLLAYEGDENFSVRTRIYRSLEQCPSPFVFAALHEATLDPHPFARAQAARSLGWCRDPTATRRLEELSSDDGAEVRRTANKALGQIVLWWKHFGRWSELARDEAAATSLVRELLETGQGDLASELSDMLPTTLSEAERQRLGAIVDAEFDAPKRRYSAWFPEANDVEAALESATDDATMRSMLADETTREHALLLVSRHARSELLPDVEALAVRPGPEGWGARRALRAMALR